MRLRRRRTNADAEHAEAEQALNAARVARQEQERKLEQEKESVIIRLDRIAQGNNIARMIVHRLAEGDRLHAGYAGSAARNGEYRRDRLHSPVDRDLHVPGTHLVEGAHRS